MYELVATDGQGKRRAEATLFRSFLRDRGKCSLISVQTVTSHSTSQHELPLLLVRQPIDQRS